MAITDLCTIFSTIVWFLVTFTGFYNFFSSNLNFFGVLKNFKFRVKKVIDVTSRTSVLDSFSTLSDLTIKMTLNWTAASNSCLSSLLQQSSYLFIGTSPPISNDLFNVKLIELSLIPEFFLGFASLTLSIYVSLIAYNRRYSFYIIQKILVSIGTLFFLLTLILMINDYFFLSFKQVSLNGLSFCNFLNLFSKSALLFISILCLMAIWQYLVKNSKFRAKKVIDVTSRTSVLDSLSTLSDLTIKMTLNWTAAFNSCLPSLLQQSSYLFIGTNLEVVSHNSSKPILPFFIVLLLFGLLLKIKIAAAPFHLWVLDVYEGSLTSATINSEPKTKNSWSSCFNNSLNVIRDSLNYVTFKSYCLYYQTPSYIATNCILPFLKMVFATSKRDRTFILYVGVLFFVFMTNYTSRILITICENGPITWFVTTFFTTVVPIWLLTTITGFISSVFLIEVFKTVNRLKYVNAGLGLMYASCTVWLVVVGSDSLMMCVYEPLAQAPLALKVDPYWLDPNMVVPILEGSPTWGSLTGDQQTEVWQRANKAWLEYARECSNQKSWAESNRQRLISHEGLQLQEDLITIKKRIEKYDRVLDGTLQEHLLKKGSINPPENYFSVVEKSPERRRNLVRLQKKGFAILREITTNATPRPIKAPWHPRFNPLNIQRCM